MQRWSPGIGDPTLIGWFTVAAYFVAAALAIRTTMMLRAGGGARDRAEFTFWVGTCIALILLGFNKQLDLQSLLTALGRCVAQIDGWYQQRRAMQAGFIIAIVGTAELVFFGFAYAMRRTIGRNGIALLGMGIIATFVMVRAVGLHHVDSLLGLTLNGWRLNWILELGGIGVVTIGAIARMSFERDSGERRASAG
ncbi:isopropylmalate isomerase [Pikeienuella piscinae]|uniref:Isopropylmalate isomerase n=1 Tax=Pikeienuella piscinae TaxID=2748098 RepID=A0A7M3T5X1_9RHOB|nr:isopropylmalate isomerase [Pikeienuella piscinae]QIE57402.1 isopropylmalate isomerase [Pikeienuella piscinae]